MRIAFMTSMLCLFPGCFPLSAEAGEGVLCSLESSGDAVTMLVHATPDTLGGEWKEMSVFKLRALLAAPAKTRPWLLLEVYAEAADGDYRIISSHKVLPPFATGQMEMVEPRLGRSLRYACKATK